MPQEGNINPMNDHDLLIKLDTKMERVFAEIREIKTNSLKRIDDLEAGKADKKQIDDLWERVNADRDSSEKRFGDLYKKYITYKTLSWAYSLIGGAVVTLILYHIFYQPK